MIWMTQKPAPKPVAAPPARVAPQPPAANRTDVKLLRYAIAIPASVTAVASKMTTLERRVLYGLVKDRYSGEGLIVETGGFLGASTVCLGEGLRANANFEAITKRWRKPIVSFERGLADAEMLAFFKRRQLAIASEHFEEETRKNVAPVADMVDARFGEVARAIEGFDQPIELLVIDGLGSPGVSRAVVKNFFPRLIPGTSIVIQRDYFSEGLPHVKTDQEFFGEHFAYLGEMASSAAFLCTREIPSAMIAALEAGLGGKLQLLLASVALQRCTDAGRRYLMAISKARLMLELEGPAAAAAYLEFVEGEFPEQASDKRLARLLKLPRVK